jgi:hypothetical protein
MSQQHNRIEGPGVELRVHDLAKELGVTSKEILAWSATNTMEANWRIGVARNCIFVIALFSKIIHCVAFPAGLPDSRARSRGTGWPGSARE